MVATHFIFRLSETSSTIALNDILAEYLIQVPKLEYFLKSKMNEKNSICLFWHLEIWEQEANAKLEEYVRDNNWISNRTLQELLYSPQV